MAVLGAIFDRTGAPVSSEDADRMARALRVHGARSQQARRLDNFSGCWGQSEIFRPWQVHERQPIIDDDRMFLFTGNLDYREDLARALDIPAPRLATMADGSLAHAAWQRWGRDALLRMEGHWAFVAIDVATQNLFAAKSPLQAPPLVYHETPDRFAISSAPKGLFALPSIPREVDEVRVADALILNFEDAERTYFKGVKALRAGHFIEVRRDRLTVSRYYDETHIQPVRLAREDDYIEALDHLMRGTVENAMHAARTPACTVSAGLDSSTVAVYALEALGREVHGLREPLLGYTHVPGKDWDGRTFGPGRIGDESGPVRALAQMYPQFDVTFVASEGLSIDHGLDDLIRISEMPPFGWNNLHWGAEIARLAREAGRNVLLGGASGNATFSFSNRDIVPLLVRQGRLLELHRTLRKMPIQQGMVKRYLRFAVQPFLPARVNKAIARYRGNMMHAGWQGFSAINPDYAHEMQVSERALERGWDDSYSTRRSPHEMRVMMTFNGNRDQNALMQLAMEDHQRVQHRDPLGCRRITEFCFGIPDEHYMKDGVDRWLARRLMRGRLPNEILNFHQRGRQSADWHARFTKDIDRLRDEVERAASDPDMAHRFDIPRMRRLFDTWPEKTPLDHTDHPDYLLAMVGVGRMVGMSRFINWVNGKN